MLSGLCSTFSKLDPGGDRSLQPYSPGPWCCLLLALSHSQFPVPDFLYPVLWDCKCSKAGTVSHNAWKTPDTLKRSIGNLFKPLFLLLPPTPSKHSVKRQKDLKIYQSGREGAGLFGCFFEFKKKDYYCQFLTTENSRDFLQKKTEYTNILAGFRSLVSWAYLGSFWKPRLLHNLQNLLSVFSPRVLLFARQSCKPEKPSKDHTTVLRLS